MNLNMTHQAVELDLRDQIGGRDRVADAVALRRRVHEPAEHRYDTRVAGNWTSQDVPLAVHQCPHMPRPDSLI